jgi:hypothetical protein
MTSPTPSLKLNGLLPLESNVLPFFFSRPRCDKMMLESVQTKPATTGTRGRAEKRGRERGEKEEKGGERKREKGGERQKEGEKKRSNHIPTYFIEQRLPLRATRPAPTLASMAVTPVGGEKWSEDPFTFGPTSCGRRANVPPRSFSSLGASTSAALAFFAAGSS